MFKSIFDTIKKLDPKTKTIMRFGFISAFTVLVISGFILFTYQAFYASPNLYYIGLQVFKISLVIAISSFVCGLVVDTIKKELLN